MNNKDVIDKITLLVSCITLVVVVIATGISWFQAYIAKDTAQRQLRAYIAVGDPHFGQIFPKSISIEIENGGQTPAYKIKARLNRQWFPANSPIPEDIDYQDFGKDAGSIAYLNPGQKKTFIFPIEHSELDRVRSGETHLLIYGHVDYFDIYGIVRTSKFSYSYQGINDDAGGVLHKLIMRNDHNEAE